MNEGTNMEYKNHRFYYKGFIGTTIAEVLATYQAWQGAKRYNATINK